MVPQMCSGKTPTNRAVADNNHDGQISFEEAHWFAVTHGSQKDIPFTSLDALAEEYYKKNPTQLISSVTAKDVRSLLGASVSSQNFVSATPGEVNFLNNYVVSKLAASDKVSLIPGQETQHLFLAQVLRRIYFRHQISSVASGELLDRAKRVFRCENQSIQNFLRNK